jgi:hypothetical protein
MNPTEILSLLYTGSSSLGKLKVGFNWCVSGVIYMDKYIPQKATVQNYFER